MLFKSGEGERGEKCCLLIGVCCPAGCSPVRCFVTHCHEQVNFAATSASSARTQQHCTCVCVCVWLPFKVNDFLNGRKKLLHTFRAAELKYSAKPCGICVSFAFEATYRKRLPNSQWISMRGYRLGMPNWLILYNCTLSLLIC